MASHLDCITEATYNYVNKNFDADFKVVIGNHEILCHKAMLTENCAYLKQMADASKVWQLIQLELESGLESIQLDECRIDTFQVMLAHMYGCTLELSRLDYEQLIRLLESSHLFDLTKLAVKVGDYLQRYINCDNILMLTELAAKYQLKKFGEICINFIGANCVELFRSSNFLNSLSMDQLVYILRDLGKGLYINEIDVYKAVIRWTDTHPDMTEVNCRELLSKCVRFELMSENEFVEHIVPKNHYTFQQYCTDKKIFERNRERKQRIVDKNFVDDHQTCITYKTESRLVRYTEQFRYITPEGLVNQQTYKRLNCFPHVKNLTESETDHNYFIIDFGKIRLINNINLHFFDNCIDTANGAYSFSYYVETSAQNDRNFYRVVDHTGYRCRSKQSIYFYARRVRYIRVVGLTTYVDLNPDQNDPYLYIRSLCCQLTSYRFDISRGFWTPDYRMTSDECGCYLISGLNEPNIECQRDVWILKTIAVQNAYTYHEIARNIQLWKKKYIMIQLPQPIFCNSLTLTVLNEGNYRYRICFARCDPETDFREPIRDEEAIDSVRIMFDNTCLQFIKINGYQKNAQRFKCSQLISPQTERNII